MLEVTEVDFIPVVQETEVGMARAFLRADQGDKSRPILKRQGLVDSGVVGPGHV